MKFFAYSFIGLMILVLLGCDPARVLSIENRTEENIQLSILYDEKCNSEFIKILRNKKELKRIKILKDGDDSKELFFFGIGSWTEEEFNDFSSCISQINILTNTDTITITGSSLKELIPQKREGIFKNYMKIEIDNKTLYQK